MAAIFSPEYLEANSKRIKELEQRFRDYEDPSIKKKAPKRKSAVKKKSRR